MNDFRPTVHEPSAVGIAGAAHRCTGCGEPWPCPTYEEGRAIVNAVLPKCQTCGGRGAREFGTPEQPEQYQCTTCSGTGWEAG